MLNLIPTNMTVRRILAFLFAAFICAEAKWHNHNHQKRDAPSICSPIYNNETKVQCNCAKHKEALNEIAAADCYLTSEEVTENDPCWDSFAELRSLHKLTFSNARGIGLDYFPSNALKHTHKLRQLDIKYANIDTVYSYAFANLSSLEEITLRDTHVKVLAVHAFAHHRNLTKINLDQNHIVEIYRNVFIDLPSLEKLYLTSNKITTIHDRAFVHLNHLRELELNMNKLFSLNGETFSGLQQLQKLDLSGNALEVIGDNTFTPLKNLHTLILESNKIQMLDEKAFNGLVNLRHLNLAHNKLIKIENERIFEGLKSLISLSFRDNEIQELKPKVMAPVLENFYNADASLDLEETSFPCDCKLEWLMKLMNKTRSKNLKITLENVKCVPDDNTKALWSKENEENDKTSGQTFEEDGLSDDRSPDYEYYDGSQLDGKLFYTDVRSIINCSKSEGPRYPKIGNYAPKLEPQSAYGQSETTRAKAAQSEPHTSKSEPATPKTKVEENTIVNHGLLDLSNYETTSISLEDEEKMHDLNEINYDKKLDSFTTSRLATVSAKPENRQMYEDKMASDEAKPDKLKAHRSIKQELKSTGLKSSSDVYLQSLLLTIIMGVFCFRL